VKTTSLGRACLATLVVGGLLLAGVAYAKYPWAKQAGPIKGQWKTTCKESGGMVVEFAVEKDKATGRIAKLGTAGKYGYSQGEEILRVGATDLGKWVGQLHWRSVSGMVRWDPITFVVKSNELDAVQTTDQCYRNMPRVK
jgi:hypothetical protein